MLIFYWIFTCSALKEVEIETKTVKRKLSNFDVFWLNFEEILKLNDQKSSFKVFLIDNSFSGSSYQKLWLKSSQISTLKISNLLQLLFLKRDNLKKRLKNQFMTMLSLKTSVSFNVTLDIDYLVFLCLFLWMRQSQMVNEL